jgi:3-hydroxyisobutyrate dehydrogenase
VFIDSSTIDVASARRAHDLAKAAGMLSLDAPVSGGVGGAEAATLTFMAGGSKDAFDKAKPVLEAMGKRVVHCGDAGAGQAAKICNNMILGISMIGVARRSCWPRSSGCRTRRCSTWHPPRPGSAGR